MPTLKFNHVHLLSSVRRGRRTPHARRTRSSRNAAGTITPGYKSITGHPPSRRLLLRKFSRADGVSGRVLTTTDHQSLVSDRFSDSLTASVPAWDEPWALVESAALALALAWLKAYQSVWVLPSA
jgi:hypothetical protein